MIDLNDFIKQNNIEKLELSKYLDVTRQTLDAWLRSNDKEQHLKIAKAINKMLDDSKVNLNEIVQGAGSMAGDNRHSKIMNTSGLYLDKYVKLLENTVEKLEQKVLDLEEQVKNLTNELNKK